MHARHALPLRWTAAIHLLTLTLLQACSGGAGNASSSGANAGAASPNQSVILTATQLRSVRVQPVTEREFAPERETVGIIDFNQDRTVQISPPYAGRIAQLMANAGDRVRQGQVLFTIDSPDLVQAESTLISAAGVLQLTTKVLERAKGLLSVQGIPQKEYEQAVSDHQTAEANYEAARAAVRIFGKTDAEIDRIEARRETERTMPVRSPITGVVAARNAAPGMLVQPGGTPAPYAVADVSTKWLLAEAPEADLPALRLGQLVDVRPLALPTRLFRGRIINISEAIDPNTRRATVRSQVADADDELRAQMFATFTLHVGSAVRAAAVPSAAVVREGDGTMSVWVTTDQRRFTRRTVAIGQQQDGFDQVLAGIRPGEQVAATGALFISNASIQGAAD